MKNHISAALFISVVLFFISNYCFAEAYPITVEVITKQQSNYLTPENTLSSVKSALLSGDLEWNDMGVSRKSLEEDILLFNEAGIDRSAQFELETQVRETLIVDKLTHNDAVILLIEDYDYDGSIKRYPLPFIKEDGLWKITNQFAFEPFIHSLLVYFPPLFDGKGQKPTDTNSFLGYESPNKARTELPTGTNQFTLHIYYGKTIDPSTFSATLNKQDISGSFNPYPFTHEEVLLPLTQGQNVLNLSITGSTQGGKLQKDSDRLVFIVP